ncbi:MAG: methyltransferase domain-containing protein [Candidatus Eisenbacteria sp.]|nr:methyltransferase domain-containing protein [Candidatus Eisenbacteria bacterium]
MQTPAERHLVQTLASFLNSRETASDAPRILDAGAGQHLSILQQLTPLGCRYVCDRTDIDGCEVDFPSVGECWTCPIDDMRPVSSGRYVAVFANYVLEHVENLAGASQEIHRVLAPGGLFVATVPNTLAPEFLLARHTPLWFHNAVRGGHAFPTQYAYKSISELLDFFRAVDFQLEEERRWSFAEGYLFKYPIASTLSRLYDRTVLACRCGWLMGQVCLVLQKPVRNTSVPDSLE